MELCDVALTQISDTGSSASPVPPPALPAATVSASSTSSSLSNPSPADPHDSLTQLFARVDIRQTEHVKDVSQRQEQQQPPVSQSQPTQSPPSHPIPTSSPSSYYHSSHTPSLSAPSDPIMFQLPQLDMTRPATHSTITTSIAGSPAEPGDPLHGYYQYLHSMEVSTPSSSLVASPGVSQRQVATLSLSAASPGVSHHDAGVDSTLSSTPGRIEQAAPPASTPSSSPTDILTFLFSLFSGLIDESIIRSVMESCMDGEKNVPSATSAQNIVNQCSQLLLTLLDEQDQEAELELSAAHSSSSSSSSAPHPPPVAATAQPEEKTDKVIPEHASKSRKPKSTKLDLSQPPNRWKSSSSGAAHTTDLASGWKLDALYRSFPSLSSEDEKEVIEQTFLANAQQFDATIHHLRDLFPSAPYHHTTPSPVAQPWSAQQMHHSKVSSISQSDIANPLIYSTHIEHQSKLSADNGGASTRSHVREEEVKELVGLGMSDEMLERELAPVLDGHSITLTTS